MSNTLCTRCKLYSIYLYIIITYRIIFQEFGKLMLNLLLIFFSPLTVIILFVTDRVIICAGMTYNCTPHTYSQVTIRLCYCYTSSFNIIKYMLSWCRLCTLCMYNAYFNNNIFVLIFPHYTAIIAVATMSIPERAN